MGGKITPTSARDVKLDTDGGGNKKQKTEEEKTEYSRHNFDKREEILIRRLNAKPKIIQINEWLEGAKCLGAI